LPGFSSKITVTRMSLSCREDQECTEAEVNFVIGPRNSSLLEKVTGLIAQEALLLVNGTGKRDARSNCLYCR